MNIPVAAEIIGHIGAFPITNAYLNSSIVTVLFIIFSLVLNKQLKKIPSKLQNGFEVILEFLLSYFDRVTGSTEKSKKFLPIVGTLFLFILCSNWFGLVPGNGTIGIWQFVHGKLELVPVLRSAGSDLNLTVAMALLSVITSHVIGMMTLGFFVHWNKFIQIGTIWNAIKSMKPVAILVALVEFVVGFIELFSEAAKVVSLSLRLFGNIFAGEVLLTVISSLISVAIPLPFMFLELIVGVIQATVFSMLTLVYLTTMTTKHASQDHDTRDENVSDYNVEIKAAH
ncbi:F0F1 ATP synthase subunit A [Candidatus Uhrbacteria bacterium]|nr:F0F1 ATP synthase subunit A [Candidatus Uhrbacteria bacterium]